MIERPSDRRPRRKKIVPKKVPKKLEVRMMEQNKLLEAANTTLREDNTKLRKRVKELEENNRGLSQSLAAREGEIAVDRASAERARKDLSQMYAVVGVLANAVNGSTSIGRVAKDFARLSIERMNLPIPSSLATRKAVKKRTSRKKS